MDYYTKENVETYIKYMAKLHQTIRSIFIESRQIGDAKMVDIKSDPTDLSSAEIFEITTTAIIEGAFNSLRLPFMKWIYIDCPFTGHKAIEREVMK